MHNTMSEAISSYDDMLDEVHGTTHIGDISLPASRILKECDPIAYRVGFHDWCDSVDLDTDDLLDDVDLP